MITIFGTTLNIYAAVLFIMLIFFVIAWVRMLKSHRLDWVDMITRDGTKISATKVLQLVGGIVATFIIIKVTLQGQLNWDLFAIYLAYVASIDGFSKFIMAKYGASNSDDSAVPYRPRQPTPPLNEFDEGPPTQRKAPRQRDLSLEGLEEIELNGAAKTNFD